MKITFVFIFIFFALCGCVSVNPYKCPSIKQRYKVVTSRDAKHMDRKSPKYRRRAPPEEKRESYGDDKDWIGN